MAKPKLPKAAIRFLVATYDDENSIYTFPQITDMIHEKFGIKVSVQAIHQNYHKYKDTINKEEEKKIEQTKTVATNNTFQSLLQKRREESSNSNQKPQVTTAETPIKKSKGFDMSYAESLTNEDIENLLNS